MAAFSPAPIALRYIPNLVKRNAIKPITSTAIVQPSFRPSVFSMISFALPATGALEVRYLMMPRNRNIVQIVTMKDLILRFT